ncbi:autophagy protein 5 [Ascosphaera aggregata]|nr:autophagy protein 5 [Ascosphaera aggregata]
MSSSADIQSRIWDGRIPLEIRLAPSESRTFDQGEPYIALYPRLSYLSLLLPKLLVFFSPLLINPSAAVCNGWFSYEDVPLRWHHPVGLLFDIYSCAQSISAHGTSSDGNKKENKVKEEEKNKRRKKQEKREDCSDRLPWKIHVHFDDFPEKDLIKSDDSGKALIDTYMNSVKEADFLRNGTAKQIMSLSKENSSGLWEAVATRDFTKFQRISNTLIPPSEPIRHVPIRVFLSYTPKDAAHISTKVLQSLFTPTANGEVQTIGSALHALLPGTFPSERVPVYCKPILHGATVPMSAPLEEVLRCAAYADGWLNIVLSATG